MRPSLLVAAVLVAVIAVLVPTSPPPAAAEELVVVGSYATPLHVTAPAGDDRLYVVERDGRVIQVSLGSDGTERSRRTFADIRGLVGTDGEGGLLSIAFSPDYATDRRVWFSYTDTRGDSVVARYTGQLAMVWAILVLVPTAVAFSLVMSPPRFERAVSRSAIGTASCTFRYSWLKSTSVNRASPGWPC